MEKDVGGGWEYPVFYGPPAEPVLIPLHVGPPAEPVFLLSEVKEDGKGDAGDGAG